VGHLRSARASRRTRAHLLDRHGRTMICERGRPYCCDTKLALSLEPTTAIASISNMLGAARRTGVTDVKRVKMSQAATEARHAIRVSTCARATTKYTSDVTRGQTTPAVSLPHRPPSSIPHPLPVRHSRSFHPQTSAPHPAPDTRHPPDPQTQDSRVSADARPADL
jgi:hypothetical protein